ncbi:peptide chain release factor I [Corynebacterium sp. CCUG 65737]|uniref:peptide chain release factor I n=1 Tax=Corynebacterium sp. CCUG 65737 TaxID=2823889 RepID=UPI00210BE22C|nr:peptide chain release factor I [Corynebacterium sp. CCUG 65737]MCQ4618663.1 peptide chain release factor I [Corynebacterium pseudogenitalium]MCQ4627724.1 peptide chain release factor I [Corynebacterium sp. CCUG 65737]
MNDLTIAPGPGIPDGAVIAADLAERFAKSSTPGGQGINTTDGKVQLSIDVAECASLTDAQRHRISRNLEHRLDGSVFTVTASTQRSVFRSWSSRLHLRHSLVSPGRSVRGSTIAPVLITSRDQRVHRRG